MAKNEERRRQLKAADRRRARRPQPAPPTRPNDAGKPPTPARLLEDTLLSAIVRFDNAVPELTDRDLRSALQSALRGGRPSSPTAAAILEVLEQVRQSQQPSPRLWRDALNQVLQSATAYEDQVTRGRNYLQFLQTIAS